MKKEEKISSIDTIKKILSSNKVVILIDYKGLNAKGMYSLRRKVKSSGSNIQIFKNTLVKRAIEGTELKALSDSFREQIAISYSSDPVALSSAVMSFAKDKLIQIKNGMMDGKVLELSTIETMSSLGSFDEVRARFIALLKAPCAKLARVLNIYSQEKKEE